MRKAMVVIGANFGDEGKGLMTDYLASEDPDNSLVVRFNGGAQAGHTVCSPDGRRHVFSHFGSGTFLNCPTFLSEFFIVNPMLFCRELHELKAKGLNPSVYIDHKAILSTPVDVFINQQLEISRGGNRHGSCGVGINETVTRCLHDEGTRTTVSDLCKPKRFKDTLFSLAENWLPRRLKELDLDLESEAVIRFKASFESIVETFLNDSRTLLENSQSGQYKPNSKRIIFEGAQGLMLDEYRLDQFPHVTRSRTGLTNVIKMLDQFAADELEIHYISRTYLTRHGAGPLIGEAKFAFPDATNIPNQFQGRLRFAPLDLAGLRYSIERDLEQAPPQMKRIKAGLTFTCADQMELPKASELPLPIRHVFKGPTRKDQRAPAHFR